MVDKRTWTDEHEEVIDDFFINLPAGKALVINFKGDRYTFIGWRKKEFDQVNLMYAGPGREPEHWNGFCGFGFYCKVADIVWDDEEIFTRDWYPNNKNVSNEALGMWCHTDCMSHYPIEAVFLVDHDNVEYMDTLGRRLIEFWYPDCKEDIKPNQKFDDEIEILEEFFPDEWDFWSDKYCRKFCNVNTGCHSNLCKRSRVYFVANNLDSSRYNVFEEFVKSYGYEV